MPAFAPAMLAAAVALSALGAVAICVLVVLYGFTPTGEEPAGNAPRRLIFTRVGHALAAVCFTATAILIATVLVRASSVVRTTVAVPDARVPGLDQEISGQETRLSETERRLHDLEEAVRRGNDEATAPAATAPAAMQTRQPPGPITPKRRQRSRAIAEPTVSSSPPAASTPSSAVVPPASSAPVSPPPPVASAPPPVTSPSHAPAPAVAASPRLASPQTETPPARPAPRQGLDLRSKLREDWREIQRGVDSGGDDFRRALEDVKRNLGLGK